MGLAGGGQFNPKISAGNAPKTARSCDGGRPWPRCRPVLPEQAILQKLRRIQSSWWQQERATCNLSVMIAGGPDGTFWHKRSQALVAQS